MNADLMITIAFCLYVLVGSLAMGVLVAKSIRNDNAKEADADATRSRRRARRREQMATVDEAAGGVADRGIGARSGAAQLA